MEIGGITVPVFQVPGLVHFEDVFLAGNNYGLKCFKGTVVNVKMFAASIVFFVDQPFMAILDEFFSSKCLNSKIHPKLP